MSVKRIAKNSAVLFLLRFLQYGFTALFSIYAARLLGTTGFGKFSFAFSYTTFFLVFADFGLSTLINQKVSRYRDATNKLWQTIGTSFFVKALLSIPVYAVMVGVINLLGYTRDTKWTVYLLGLSILVHSFTVFFAGVFRGLEKMEYEALSSALERPLIFAIGVWLLTNDYGIISLALLFLVARLLTLFVTVATYFAKVRRIAVEKDFALWKELVIEAFPYGLFLIFGTIYFQIDTIMLSLFKGDQAVGIFESVIRLVMVLMIIPEAFTESIFPILSRSFHLGQGKGMLYRKSLKLMLLIGIPITVGLFGLADKIVLLLYDATYLPAVPVLRTLAFIICIRFLAYVPGVLLTSVNGQTTRMLAVGVCAIFNLVANLFVIPKWGVIGAAANTVLTNILLLSLYIVFVWRRGYALKMWHWRMGVKILACAVGLYGSVIAFRSLSLFAIIPISAAIYLLLLFLLGVVQQDERDFVRRIFTSEVTSSP